MASCWDCIHCKVCGVWKNAESLTQQTERAETLECFENKADFVKAVRCGDCIYAEKHYDTTHLIGNIYFPSGVPTKLLYITCKYHVEKCAENDFCSYGRPKEVE